MSIVRALPELEIALAESSTVCEPLADHEYKQLVAQWKAAFGPLIEARGRHLSGSRVLESTRARLPQAVFIFSGVSIPQVANLGGRGPVAYRVPHLELLDVELLRKLELILVAADLSWSCVFSHECGSLVQEELYELPGAATEPPIARPQDP